MTQGRESPKQQLQAATARQMAEMIKRSREHSAGRAAERTTIAGWLRGVARGAEGQPPVDRAECLRLVADLVEKAVWLDLAPELGS